MSNRKYNWQVQKGVFVSIRYYFACFMCKMKNIRRVFCYYEDYCVPSHQFFSKKGKQ